jgi:hypothetical protein
VKDFCFSSACTYFLLFLILVLLHSVFPPSFPSFFSLSYFTTFFLFLILPPLSFLLGLNHLLSKLCAYYMHQLLHQSFYQFPLFQIQHFTQSLHFLHLFSPFTAHFFKPEIFNRLISFISHTRSYIVKPLILMDDAIKWYLFVHQI